MNSAISEQGFDYAALAKTLPLGGDASAEWVDFDPSSGDYRVYSLSLAATAAGGVALQFELYRQGPGFKRRLFPVLSLFLGRADAAGISPVTAYHSDANIALRDLPAYIPTLIHIITALQDGQRPQESWVEAFLSRSARILWSKPLPIGGLA